MAAETVPCTAIEQALIAILAYPRQDLYGLLAEHPENIPEGCCTGVELVASVRYQALENLWAAWKHPDMERLGYSPEFSNAVKQLRELERSHAS